MVFDTTKRFCKIKIAFKFILKFKNEAIPSQSSYNDNLGIHRYLDKTSATYMYTILTGDCVLDSEPADKNSFYWKTGLLVSKN